MTDIFYPGMGRQCRCGERAFLFALCHECRQLVATCGGHRMTLAQERHAHCVKAAP